MPSRRVPRYLAVPDLRPHESPRWVPLPLSLLDDYRLSGLSDTARWHYVGICLLAARCGNRLRGDAEWIARRIHATEPIDLLLLYHVGLLVAWSRSRNSPERSGNFGATPGQDGKNSGQNGKTRDIAGQNRVTSLCNSPPPLTADTPYSRAEESREEERKEQQQQQQRAGGRAREGGGCGGGSRHDAETLRLYAASRPNARSVRELARYFARTGSADGEIDEWLAERRELEEEARRRREAGEAAERLRHEAAVAEIVARGGPHDDVERMLCESLSPPRGQNLDEESEVEQ